MSKELPLAKVEPQQLDVATDPTGLMRLAIERGGEQCVAILERLMPIRREIKAEQAKEAFDRALSAFQAECPQVNRPKGVATNSGKLAFSYAPLEYIISLVKPLLQKHGFNYTLDTNTDSADGWVIAKCHVTHEQGHCRTSEAKFPLGSKTAIMSDTQAFGAALTFASRRVFCNAFGIVTAGEDLEENLRKREKAVASKPMTEEEKALKVDLWNVLAPVRGKEKNWDAANRWMIDECVLSPEQAAPNLSVAELKSAIERAKAKLP